MENGASEDRPTSQYPAGPGATDPVTPDHDDAAAALTIAAAAESAQKRVTRTPAWFYVSMGFCLGGLIGTNAIDTDWVRHTVGLGAAAIMALAFWILTWTWRRKGIRPPFGAQEYPASAIFLLMAVSGVVVLSGLLLGYRRPDWALAVGATTFVIYTAVALTADAWFFRRGRTANL